MPLAVTHVLLTIILVDLYRDYVTKHKKYFTLHTVFLAGLGGLLPDLDVPLNWMFSFIGYQTPLLQHGGITHTLFFGLLFLIPALILYARKKHVISIYFLVISFGIFFHIFLDWFLGGGGAAGIMLLWPISIEGYALNLLRNIPLSHANMALDAIILLLWLYHEETKHKIRDFI